MLVVSDETFDGDKISVVDKGCCVLQAVPANAKNRKLSSLGTSVISLSLSGVQGIAQESFSLLSEPLYPAM